jgi:hypothetical protein
MTSNKINVIEITNAEIRGFILPPTSSEMIGVFDATRADLLAQLDVEHLGKGLKPASHPDLHNVSGHHSR